MTAHIASEFIALSEEHPAQHWLTTCDAHGQIDWTYGEIATLITRYAAAFKSHGVVPGDVIFIVADSKANCIAAFLAAMAIAAVPSYMPPISTRQDPARFWAAQDALIGRVKPKLILASGRTLAAGLQRLNAPVFDLDAMQVDPGPGALTLETHPVAFLQHTSGTTATKKGVMISHTAAADQLRAYADRLALEESDSVVSWLPLYHDMGLVACLLLSVYCCKPLTLIDPFVWVMKPGLLFEMIEKQKGTLVWMPNFAFNHLARTAASVDRDLSSLRLVVNCSEPCRAESMENFLSTFESVGVSASKVRTCYAMAETVFAISQQPTQQPVRILEVDRVAFDERSEIVKGKGLRLASSGPPLPDVEVRVLDAHGNDLPEERVGEISIRAPFLFSGYHQMPQASAEKFRDGFYLTGDRGFLSNGEVFIVGRLDDVIVINGKKIDAAEVEHVLTQVSGLHTGRAVAFGLWNELVGSHELAIVFEADEEANSAVNAKKAVREAINDSFALLPAVVEVRGPGWIVKSTSGKISRRANLHKYLEEHGLG
jgi:acyl-CoA synthetase (AMP-forming)/AMP-acid ligase II